MAFHGSVKLLLVFLCAACSISTPIPEEQIDNNVAKRTLDEKPPLQKSIMFNPYAGMYPGMFPGMKLGPLMAQAMLMNSLATPVATDPAAPAVDPVAAYFKAKKDEFINKLYADMNAEATAAGTAKRASEVLPDDDTVTVAPTTVKPKIDPSIIMAKKFSFLATLFKTLNTTTVAPDPDTLDPTATTIKPTIVPPSFWDFGFGVKPPKPPKTPKPPKAEKPTKPPKVKSPAVDDDVTETIKSARATFLDKLLHRVTEATPVEDEIESEEESSLTTRGMMGMGMFPPGYWIPPYIYAAKMGLYLDKMFDTIDSAAAAENAAAGANGTPAKRAASTSDPTSLILDELQSLKNEMVVAYTEGLKAAKGGAKPPAKGGKKLPPWLAAKTTPAPDTVQEKLDVLSQVFDSLATLEHQLVNGEPTSSPSKALAKTRATESTTADPVEVYGAKTQEFLTQLFSENAGQGPSG